jgi:hypothetical protein
MDDGEKGRKRMNTYQRGRLRRRGRRTIRRVNVDVQATPIERKKGKWEIAKRVLNEIRFFARMGIVAMALLHFRQLTHF